MSGAVAFCSATNAPGDYEEPYDVIECKMILMECSRKGAKTLRAKPSLTRHWGEGKLSDKPAVRVFFLAEAPSAQRFFM